MNAPPATYSQQKLASVYRQIEERLERLPGIQGRSRPLQSADGQLGRAHPGAGPSAAADEWRGRRLVGSRQRQLPAELRRDAVADGPSPTADTETTEHVAVVNEAFVKRFFKSGEDPLDQHFGLDLPENASTFRIVGVVRDAKFAGWGLSRPARPMFYVPLAQNVDYKNPSDEADRASVAFHRRR